MSESENEDVFTAGQDVAPGTYRRVDVLDGRLIDLPHAAALPASLDGRVALYRRVVPLELHPLGADARTTAKPLVAID